ncbi:LAME_0G03444g1_1 [Lachancea meyersii CBS 8951]|uniref:Ribosomal RNA-processing protein 43 n=1 Tax=Lachancea meyersii CBS 8951 TaxID=1266667 RepID=A0A1G4K6N2_9SACH|nr:LAME_0G03444g1_1 [Lachancea meyersii CBS 8951]
MAESVEIRPMTFHREVLARIAPDLYMQRHLSLGLRPSLRAFEEFRNVEISDGRLSCASEDSINREGNNILGSNVLKCGKTMVITSITGGVVEENIPVKSEENEIVESYNETDRAANFGQVYPVVEVERGRVGAPTDEEMTLSQRIYNCILHSGLVPKTALDVAVGVRSTDAEGKTTITYSDEQEADGALPTTFKFRRKWTYTLYAKIQVFSRDGPLFELCWNSLLYALANTKIPRAFVDERTTDLKIPISMRGRSAAIRETFDIICDPTSFLPLRLNTSNKAFASNFAVIDLDPEVQLPKDDDDMQDSMPSSVLLADIQGEAEEASVTSTISVVTDGVGNLKHFKAVGGSSKITMDMMRNSIKLAKLRASDLDRKC